MVERFGKEHPEILAMDENGKRYLEKGNVYYGNLCYTSKILRNELFNDAKAYLTGQPASSRNLPNWNPSCFSPGFFNIMPKDHFRTCYCPTCREYYKKHSEAELVWDLTADIANRLLKEKIPGYITAMAYGHYPNPPALALPENVLVMIQAGGPWQELNPPQRAMQEKRIADWTQKLGRRPWTWSYTGKCGIPMPNIPSMTPRMIGKYFSRISGRITGSFMESETDYWMYGYLNYYTAQKVFWNNQLDVEKLLDEHHRLMFGKAAAPMKRFFDRIEELWLTRITGRIVETPLGPQAIQPTDMEVWEKIYSPAEFKQFRKWFAEAASLAADDPDARKRVEYFSKYFLGQMEKGADAYNRTRQGVAQLGYNAGKAFEPVVIDGKLDDAAWKNTEFAWLLPMKEQKNEVNTQFKICRDSKYLYFAAVCEEPYMDKISANIKTNDAHNLWTDSVIEFFLLPKTGSQTYFHWILNSKGAWYDSKSLRQDSESIHNSKWNSGIIVSTACNANSWTIEAAIPLESLEGLAEDKVPFNVARYRVVSEKIKQPYYTFSPYIGGFHDIENFGSLCFEPEKLNPNLVINGDFTMERKKGNNFGGWHMEDGVPKPEDRIYFMDTRCFRTGGQALRIESRDAKPHGITHFFKDLKPATRYHLTFSVRMENVRLTGKNKWGGFVVNYGTGDGVNRWYPEPWFLGTVPWSNQGLFFTTPKEADKKRTAAIRFVIQNAEGTVWLDDIQLREVEKP